MFEPDTLIDKRYRVVRRIGEGGMGTVYEAEHLDLDRRVAIKVVRSDIARDPDVVDRFKREARMAAAVGHHGVIDVMDFGMHEGAPYLVMEYLHGEPLNERLALEPRPPLAFTMHVMAQVLSTLEAVHAVGVVHRDLKPENVFLIEKGGVPNFVKLLDFGISKVMSTEESPSLTRTGTALGTPYYSAPEQLRGRRNIDRRADIYAAGVMLYEMLTGRVPFDAESQADLFVAVLSRPDGVTPPSAYNAECSPALDAIVERAMQLRPDDRYASATEFAKALEPFGATVPVFTSEVTKRHSLAALTPPARESRRLREMVETQLDQTAAPLGSTDVGRLPTDTPLASASAGRTESSRRTPKATQYRAVIVAVVLVAGLVAAFGAQYRRAPAAARSVASGEPAPVVAVDLLGVPASATVLLDGIVAPSPHFALARGTTHSLRVSAAGREPFETSIHADRTEVIAVVLPPDADAAALPTNPTPAQQTGVGGVRSGRVGAAHHRGPLHVTTEY